jgi:hypothetical protein
MEALHPHPGGDGGQEAEGALVGLRLQCHEGESHLFALIPFSICSGHLHEGVCRQTAGLWTAVQSTLSVALQQGAESAAGTFLSTFTMQVHCD